MWNLLVAASDSPQMSALLSRLGPENCNISLIRGFEDAQALSVKESFDAFLMDMDHPAEKEDPLTICRRLKEDERLRHLPVLALVSESHTPRIVDAVAAGVDRILMNPVEAEDLLDSLRELSFAGELNAKGKKCINLEHINLLTRLMEKMTREDFFRMAPVLFDHEIIGRVKDIIGDMVFAQIFARLREGVPQGYEFMKEARYSHGHFSLGPAEKTASGIPVETLAAGLRHYISDFFRLIHALTSHILFGRPLEILLVEDNPGDVRLVQEALKEGRLPIRLSVVTDGEAAMDYFQKKDRYRNAPAPDLVLLDLNLPKKDGREVLKAMKASSPWSLIPVIIMTVSKEERDSLKSQGVEVEFYIVKPFDLDQFIGVIETIRDSRFDAVKILS